ncbi:MAG: protein kinase, partial [Thermoanaerobaculia bacterium]
GRVKILDFGLSKLLEPGASETLAANRHTAQGMIVGTLDYLSPEQALGDNLDARTDLFSFGIVLYEMLAGEHPYPAASLTQQMAKIITQPARPWSADSGVSVPLREIVDRLLRKNPAERYDSAESLLADLEQTRQGSNNLTAPMPAGTLRRASSNPPSMTAPYSTQFEPMKPSAATRRPLVAALVTLGLLVASAAVLFSARRARPLPAAAAMKTSQVTSSAGLDLFPSFSPDAASIAYSSERGGSFEIYVKQLAAGGREIQITSDQAGNLEPAWSPDGRSIAYVSTKRGGIWVVPSLGGVPKRLTEFGSHPAWSYDGTELAFQSEAITDLSAGAFPAFSPSTIWTIPAAGGEPRALTTRGVPQGGHGAPSWSPDGKFIVFIDYIRPESELWCVPTKAGSEAFRISNSQPSYFDPVYAPDGKAIYFCSVPKNASSGIGMGLWKLPMASSSRPVGLPTEILNVGLTTIKQSTISHDGTRLAFSALGMSSNLMAVSSDGKGPLVPLTRGTVRNSRPAFSPDGKHIAFSNWKTGTANDIWVMDSAGGNSIQLTTNPALDDYPAWFPDGQSIAFTSSRRGTLSAWSVPPQGGEEKLLGEYGEIDSARLSHDGKWFAFNSKRAGGTTNVWLVPVSGGAARQLTFDKEFMGFPCWSRDSRFIALEAKRGADQQIYVVPRDGGEPKQVTKAPGLSWPASFSPDGDRIAFASFREGHWEIRTVSRTTGQEEQLTHIEKLHTYVRYPDWSPKDDRVVFEYAETSGNIWLVENLK